MDNKQPSTPPQRRRFFAVRLTADQIRWQLDNYYTLPIHRSARGIAVLWLVSIAFLIALFGSFIAFQSPSPVYTLGRVFLVLAPLLLMAFFIYRGHRWAMISAILLLFWVFFLSGTRFNFILFFIWLYFAQFFYQAFQVENARNVTTNQQTRRVSS